MKKLENKTGMPINLLIDELKSEDIRKRIHSVKNLSLIASTIGPDRARNELVPFLQAELLDDEDEVLTELIDSLSTNFSDYLGGAQNQVILMPLLESLCKVEDPNVRERVREIMKTFQSALQIKKIYSSIQGDQKKSEELIMGLLRRLSENEYYMSKSSLAFLIPSVISTVSSNSQNELIQAYQKMITDQIPSVRKFASINFKDMIKLHPLITEGIINNGLMTFYKDEQDFIRLYVVDSLIALNKTQLNAKNPNLALNLYKQLAEDSSWRVRYYFCEKLSEVAQVIGKEQYKKNFQAYHLKFLQDPEPEMKSIASLRVEELGELMDIEDITGKLLPILKQIQADSNGFVRNSLASSLLVLSPLLGKKGCTDHILPIFLLLLKDQDSEVRITLFKKLSLITKVVGVDTLSQYVIPALTELAQDKNWRIRSSTIEVLAFFARAIGAEFLSEKVIKLQLDWLSDKVYAVREASISSVKKLIEILGPQWSEKNLLGKILAFQQNTNYLHRLTVLFTITNIASLVSAEYLSKQMTPVLLNMAKDSIANVRLNVCKTIKATYSCFSQKDKEQLKKAIQSLNEDQDYDVKYHAKVTLDSF